MAVAVVVLGIVLAVSTIAINGVNLVKIVHVTKKKALVVSHPVRHPKKDAKAVAHHLKYCDCKN